MAAAAADVGLRSPSPDAPPPAGEGYDDTETAAPALSRSPQYSPALTAAQTPSQAPLRQAPGHREGASGNPASPRPAPALSSRPSRIVGSPGGGVLGSPGTATGSAFVPRNPPIGFGGGGDDPAPPVNADTRETLADGIPRWGTGSPQFDPKMGKRRDSVVWFPDKVDASVRDPVSIVFEGDASMSPTRHAGGYPAAWHAPPTYTPAIDPHDDPDVLKAVASGEWEAHRDPDTGRRYYVHVGSNLSVWDLAEELDRRRELMQNDTVQQALHSGAWKAARDAATSGTYYYHPDTGRTVWELTENDVIEAETAAYTTAEAERAALLAGLPPEGDVIANDSNLDDGFLDGIPDYALKGVARAPLRPALSPPRPGPGGGAQLSPTLVRSPPPLRTPPTRKKVTVVVPEKDGVPEFTAGGDGDNDGSPVTAAGDADDDDDDIIATVSASKANGAETEDRTGRDEGEEPAVATPTPSQVGDGRPVQPLTDASGLEQPQNSEAWQITDADKERWRANPDAPAEGEDAGDGGAGETEDGKEDATTNVTEPPAVSKVNFDDLPPPEAKEEEVDPSGVDTLKEEAGKQQELQEELVGKYSPHCKAKPTKTAYNAHNKWGSISYLDDDMKPKIEASLKRRVVRKESQAKLDAMKEDYKERARDMKPFPKPAVPIYRADHSRAPPRPLGVQNVGTTPASRRSHPDDPENTGVLPRLSRVDVDLHRPPSSSFIPIPSQVRPLTTPPPREAIDRSDDGDVSVNPCVSPVRGVRLKHDGDNRYRLDPTGEELALLKI